MTMKITNASTFIVGIFVAFAVLAGCSSGSPSALTPSAGLNAIHPLGVPMYHGVLITAFRPGVPLARAFKNALVTPDRGKRHKKLGYISNFYSDVLEFHFPKGAPLGGAVMSDDPQGMCSKTHRGDFWIADSGSDAVEEYEAGGTSAIKSLSVSAEPAGCAISTSTGDLAVSMQLQTGVVIFKHASGSGTKIADEMCYTYFLGYDPSGDLFADGIRCNGQVALDELPASGSTFHNVTLPNTVGFPGSVQWDGTYIAVGDQNDQAIYRYSVSGSTATLEGTVTYSGASDCVDGDIYKGYYLCPDAGDFNAKVYAYPAGGAPLYSWTGSFDLPIGAVVVEK